MRINSSIKMTKGYIPIDLDIPWSLGKSDGYLITKYANMATIVTAIHTEYHLATGERLAVLGNIDILNNWETSRPRYAHPGAHGPGSWSFVFPLPTDKMVELKWCVVRDKEVVRWEDGFNHVLAGPNFGLPAKAPKLTVQTDPLLEALELGISELFAEEDEDEEQERSHDDFYELKEQPETPKQHGRWCRLKKFFSRNLRRMRSCV